ncbi:tetratricopeptide repeat protein [Winogradskyella sp. UBA3174]|uniref:tetratricopeptide repeat protein n=1 Tax=Winogradskyella sp. UBA3174 TaxID=1947785 RepID=UPI0025D52EEA|nr:tetratricopeptide repeat protein [Winogradskyella sp. UBA3174]|tara:strand:- start:3849 stop:5543 length:1695 start_codon:yes stop_codon:yes gene_type:complete
MNSLQKSVKLFCLIFLISIIACKDNLVKPNPALATIDLQRGDILLCGNPQFGAVSFALDCKYDVRETFDLAISLLHSFEYDEAEKAFVKVIDADPECAMAYWGVAMSIYHELWAPPGPKELKKGTVLLEIAESLRKSERSERYLDAIKVFYKDWKTLDHKTRELLYEKKMEQIYLSQKDDTEAAIFYALAITSAADPNDKTYSSQKKSGAILQKLFKKKPNHPGIAHYVIHTYDYPEIAQSALSTARRYAEIAPASAHAQHMPSHIFTRLGLWQESIDTNINSALSAVCYAESANPGANWAQEIHAMDYLVYAYLQQGNNKEVDAQNAYLKSMKKIFPLNHFAVAYTANAIPARIALENRQWKEAANLERPNIEFDWNKFPWSKSILHFARAMGSARSGDIASAENELNIIESFHKELLEMNSAEATYKAGQVRIEIKTTEAWINLAKGNNDEALTLMKIASKLESETSKHPVTPGEVLPADELLGDMLLALNQPEEALVAYEENLKGHPNRFNGLYGAAIAAEKSGNREKATLYFKQLIELTKNSKSNRPELSEAKTYIKQAI